MNSIILTHINIPEFMGKMKEMYVEETSNIPNRDIEKQKMIDEQYQYEEHLKVIELDRWEEEQRASFHCPICFAMFNEECLCDDE